MNDNAVTLYTLYLGFDFRNTPYNSVEPMTLSYAWSKQTGPPNEVQNAPGIRTGQRGELGVAQPTVGANPIRVAVFDSSSTCQWVEALSITSNIVGEEPSAGSIFTEGDPSGIYSGLGAGQYNFGGNFNNCRGVFIWEGTLTNPAATTNFDLSITFNALNERGGRVQKIFGVDPEVSVGPNGSR